MAIYGPATRLVFSTVLVKVKVKVTKVRDEANTQLALSPIIL